MPKTADKTELLAALYGEQRDLRAQMKRTQGRYGENKRLDRVKKQIAELEARPAAQSPQEPGR